MDKSKFMHVNMKICILVIHMRDNSNLTIMVAEGINWKKIHGFEYILVYIKKNLLKDR